MTRRSRKADAQAIAHHYDVSNEFYALFLDPLMVYTCAYYRDPDGKLEQSQQDKLDLVCRKLDLQRGETLLDLGCGWGISHSGGSALWRARSRGDPIAEQATTPPSAPREGPDRCQVEHYRRPRALPTTRLPPSV